MVIVRASIVNGYPVVFGSVGDRRAAVTQAGGLALQVTQPVVRPGRVHAAQALHSLRYLPPYRKLHSIIRYVISFP